ncbi:MAG: glycerophosphodiester phosphodiesterase [Terriglobales bacterium]|jgi:glycerophosphoryl diester phosphodiesterase|nr:glycerophosphodiester phosphodiesterase [Terriglobales bacterium]
MAYLPLLIGHRGARSSPGVAENTIAAFDLAMQQGCNGFEFDVRLAACGTPVVCHDPQAGKFVIARTAAAKLSSLPTLDAVLQRYCAHGFLDIELKVRDLESKVLTSLHAYPPQHGYVVSSFIPDVVMDLEARSATLTIGIICETAAQLAMWARLPADYVIPHHSLVDRPLVDELQMAGRKILVWTVNDPDAMLRLAEWGVDGIISDDPELLAHTLK